MKPNILEYTPTKKGLFKKDLISTISLGALLFAISDFGYGGYAGYTEGKVHES